MTAAVQRPATYADLEALPANMVGEIIDGALHANPRPASRHARASSRLGMRLGSAFDSDDGEPGGWILLDEPELHLGPDVLVPDLAGWRRTRMPELPHTAAFDLAPDWICEVLSPGTAAVDRTQKLPIYARQGVGHAWLIDPIEQTLEAFARDGARWTLLGAWSAEAQVTVEPFEGYTLSLSALWAR